MPDDDRNGCASPLRHYSRRSLKQAADLLGIALLALTPEERWTKGALARDRDGCPVEPDDQAAVCWSVWGALLRVLHVGDPALHVRCARDPVTGEATAVLGPLRLVIALEELGRQFDRNFALIDEHGTLVVFGHRLAPDPIPPTHPTLLAAVISDQPYMPYWGLRDCFHGAIRALELEVARRPKTQPARSVVSRKGAGRTVAKHRSRKAEQE
jgi:hypothetical protein